MTDSAVDFLLDCLKQLIKRKKIVSRLSLVENDQIKSLYEELGSLRKFLKDMEGKRREHEEVRILVSRIGDVVYVAEDEVDLFMLRFLCRKKKSLRNPRSKKQKMIADIEKNLVQVCPSGEDPKTGVGVPAPAPTACPNGALMLDAIIKEIKSIKKEVKKIYDKNLYGIGVPQAGMCSHGSSSRISAPSVEEETVIGFDQEAEMIKERLLDNNVRKQLEVISIVGMPGLGKTTLARKVYNDLLIVYHFYIRGWTCVSHAPLKRDLLLSILNSVVEHMDEMYTLSDEKLGEELYKRLSGKRYLIVMDDIWHIQAWIDLKNYFPNNNNGSRIIFTSRITDRALCAKPDSSSHSLRFLTEDESWDLLRIKVFGKESCPPDFIEIGRQIAVKCQGLPLAIVVIAGLLAKTDRAQDWWKQVAESVSSHILSDTAQCMDTLAISYNHLPHHLKSCFLYLGAFPEDYEIPVRKLIWLWIAEGFIKQNGNKNLEDAAEECLMDLIGRSLILVARKRSTGEIKSCRVHDLLRDLCLRKAQEENFLQQISVHEEFPPSSILFAKKHRRLCLHSHVFDYISLNHSAPHIRSLLSFASEQGSSSSCHTLIHQVFKLLRVLDLSAISVSNIFPKELLELVLLRYLALQGKNLYPPSSISKLQNLETLILSKACDTAIPSKIWKMIKLRHLCITGMNYIYLRESQSVNPPVLYNLQTLSQVYPSADCKNLLHRIPNLRKLGFCGEFSLDIRESWFPNLSFLEHLETLKLFNRSTTVAALSYADSPGWNLPRVKFPPSLKRLTLSRTFLKWREMLTLEMLPNLEALKLEFQAFVGPLWETNEEGFRKLRFLRLYYMYMEQWHTCSNHFPSLQCLVLHRCEKLSVIPSELGDISTLHTIEVTHCSHSAANSARQIQEEQQRMGNDWLKIFIYPSDWELTTYS